LDRLGWYQFEQLCQAVAKHLFGPTVLTWSGHSDGGRDAYCETDLTSGAGVLAGPIVFQIKFVEQADAAGAKPEKILLTAVSREIQRIRERQAKDEWVDCATYFLMTNVDLTTTLRGDVSGLIEPETGAHVVVFGGRDICDVLDGSSDLRMAYPQILGLTDLDRILRRALNQATLERSSSALSYAGDLAKTFVPTAAYDRTLQLLRKYSFAVLTGPPEYGKSAVAFMIGLAKGAEGWEFIECRTPIEFFGAYNAAAQQFFVVDDAFGATEFRPDLANAWGDDLDRVLRKLDKTHWLGWTSRPAPLALALKRLHLQGLAEQFPDPGEVIVDATALTTRTKALMLYRHCKNAGLPVNAVELVRLHGERIVENRHFTPERIRRFATGGLTAILDAAAKQGDVDALALGAAIDREIAEPTRRMRTSFAVLDAPHQWLLLALLDLDSWAHEPVLIDGFRRHYGDTVSPSEIIDDLSEHFIERVDSSRFGGAGGITIRWKHPSWRDLVIERLMELGDLRRRFLAGVGRAGFSLAISAAGGAVGERTRPLLQSTEDWKVLTQRSSELISRGGSLDISSMLGQLEEAVGQPDGNPPPQLLGLADVMLRACVARWIGEPSIGTMTVLEKFYAVAERVGWSDQPDGLLGIWELRHSKLTDLVAEGDQGSTPQAETLRSALGGLAKLAILLQNREPAFLESIDFPYSTEAVVKAAFRLMDRALEEEDVDEDDDDARTEQMESLNEAQTTADSWAGVMPAVALEAQGVAQRCEAEWFRLNSVSEEKPQADGPDEDYDFRDLQQSEPSVAEILSDL
jgi:hypothetical protein